MYKILVSDALHEKGMEILKGCSDLQVDVKVGLPVDELKKIVGGYDALAVRSATKVNDDLLKCATNLKVICRAGIGVDNIDVGKATERGVVVMNTPAGNSVTTAEHTMGLMLSMARLIPQATSSMKKGEWEKKAFMGVELLDKTLGIVGLGNIGSIVADRAHGFKMKVVAYDPFLSKDAALKKGAELVTLDELFKTSDFISIHIPLIDSTRNMIGKDEFNKMKTGVYFVNCARGGLVDEVALLDALNSKKVAGAALDVFGKEPPPADSPLLKHPKVICTPHLGASTEEAQEKVAIDCGRQLIDFFVNGVVSNAVNLPSISPEQAPILQPYQRLAEKLGKFHGQIVPGGAKKITLEYHGDITELDTKTLTLSYLKGYFSTCLDTPVTEVNAPIYAKNRGVEVIEQTSSKQGEFTSLMAVSLTTDEQTSTVAGSVFRANEPRIVGIDKFNFEALPEGDILVVRNQDRPGVVGSIGTILGENKINISRMQLGLDSQAKQAIMLINIDSKVPPAILEKVSAISGMISAKQIYL